ncbi:MAG: hypothetical protein ACREUW_17265 [Burkholderiales bacterium]
MGAAIMASQPLTGAGPGRLDIADKAACQRWLDALPVTNVPFSLQQLSTQLELFAQAEIAAPERLRVLETLRETVLFVAGEAAKKFTARPLPLDTQEGAAWDRVVGLWRAMAVGYAKCLEACKRGELSLATQGPLVTAQALAFTSRAMFESYRVYRDIEPAAWQRLHALYASAEELGYAQTPVSDRASPQTIATSCCAAYARALLAQLANPFALSGRQLAFMDRWLDTWSGLVGLATQPLPPSSVPALAVDLAGDAGPQLAEQVAPGPGVRYLDLERLAPVLKSLILSLKQGRVPAELGLGADARQPGCESLIMLLYIQWCRAGTARTEARAPTQDKLQVCLGLHAAHFHATGRSFRQPGVDLMAEEEHDLQMFGHISERTQRLLASQESAALETWELVNQSASGFLCMVREPQALTKLSHNQLIALRRPSGRTFFIGTVQWLRFTGEGELRVGLRLFPGAPRALAARPTGPNVGVSMRYDRALLLPEVPAPATPATLLLPSGWYAPGRVIELFTDRKQLVRLQSLLEKGADYDRCTVAAEP